MFLLSTVIRYTLSTPGDLFLRERENLDGSTPCPVFAYHKTVGAPPVGPKPMTLRVDFSRWDFPSEIRAVGAVHCLGI